MWYHVQNFCWLQSKTHSWSTLLSEVRVVLERASHHRLVLLALKRRLFIQTHCVETPQGGVADGLHGLLREPGLGMGGLKKHHGHEKWWKQPVSSGFTSSEIWWGKSEKKKTSFEFIWICGCEWLHDRHHFNASHSDVAIGSVRCLRCSKHKLFSRTIDRSKVV